jgi:hypothetical protein
MKSMQSNTMNDLYNARAWLWREFQHITHTLSALSFWLVAISSLLLAVLAYQTSPSYNLAIGGDTATRLREYDTPFLIGFNASEPDPPDQEWWQLAVRPYRWAEPHAELHLPAIGNNPWIVTLGLNSGRPDGAPSTLQLVIGTEAEYTLVLAPADRRYHIMSSDVDGDLIVRLRSEPYIAQNDPRSLGVVVYALQVQSLVSGPYPPAFGQVVLQVALAVVGYAIAQRLSLGRWIASLIGVSIGAVTALLLVTDRLGLTIATPGLVLIAAICFLLAPLLDGLLASMLGWLALATNNTERGAAVALMLAGFAARMVGITHPYAQFSDLFFNANNQLRVIRGNLLLTAGLPCEAGAGSAPYPPAQYLFTAPLQLVFADDTLRQVAYLLQGSVAFFESMGTIFVWLLLRHLRLGRRAALLAAALYTLPTPLLGAYSVGEMANLFGQAFVPFLLLTLAVWPGTGTVGRHWHKAVLVVVLVAILLLSHTGVTISALCLLLAWFLLSLPRLRQLQLVPLGLIMSVAGTLAFGLFYSAYTHLPTANQQARQALAARTPALICPPGSPIGEKLVRTIGGGLGANGTLATPLVITAALTLVGIRTQARLHTLLYAGVLGTALSFGTLLGTDQPVRWAHFLFPLICLAAGVSFAAWMQRGIAGRIFAWLLLLSILVVAATEWVRQVSENYH